MKTNPTPSNLPERQQIFTNQIATLADLKGLKQELRHNAPAVVQRIIPAYAALYSHRGWKMHNSIDRVYINERARKALGWEPKYDFAHVVARLQAGESLRSPLAQLTGSKGYHTESFVDGPYPIN